MRIEILLLTLILTTSILVSKDNKPGVITLKPICKLESGNEYVFQYPSQITVNRYKDLFVLDKNQILQLDGKGSYKRNLFKKGQGPGEFKHVERVVAGEESLLVHQVMPNKFVLFKFDGEMLKEVRPEIKTNRLLFYFKKKYYFLKFGFDGKAVPEGKFRDTKSELLEYSVDGKIKRTGLFFPARWQSERIGEFTLSDQEFPLIYALLEDTLICSSTGDYQIDFIDLKRFKVLNTVKQKYEKVEFFKPEEKVAYSTSNDKFRKYFRDIMGLMVHKNRLLVVTSKFKEDRGVLVDIYLKDGKFVESRWLALIKEKKGLKELRSMALLIEGDYLYKEEEDQDGHKVFGKYELGFK